MAEVGKIELGSTNQDRSKASIEQNELWLKEGQNKVLGGVKKDLLGMKEEMKKTTLVNTKITARNGDTVGALALAVDRSAAVQAREATKEAKKADPDAEEVTKEVAVKWDTPVEYRDGDGNAILTCTLSESKFLSATDVVFFENDTEGNTTVVVTLNNEKSLAKVQEFADKLKKETEELDKKIAEYVKRFDEDYSVTLSNSRYSTNTTEVKGLKDVLKLLALLDRTLAKLKKDSDADKDTTFEKVKEIYIDDTDADKDGDKITLNMTKLTSTAKIEKFLKEAVAEKK